MPPLTGAGVLAAERGRGRALAWAAGLAVALPLLVAAPLALLVAAAVLVPVLALRAVTVKPERMLTIFVWALPVHSLVIAVLFAVARLPQPFLRALAAWKEIAVLWLVLVVFVRSLTRPGRTRVTLLDVGVGTIVLASFTHAVMEQLFARTPPPAVAQLYGIRDLCFFLLLYFVGRATPDVAEDPAVLQRIVMLAVVTSLIAIPERLFVSPEMLVLIGVSAYFTQFLGAAEFTTHNDYGLPSSYWSRFGNVEVRRAGSVFLSAQGFAVPFLLLMPAATLWLLEAPAGRRGRRWLAYLVVWTGLLLTLTRVTIAVCLAQVLAILFWRKRTPAAVIVIGVGGLFIAGVIAAWPALARFVWDTLTWQTGSSESHAEDWKKALDALFDYPLGAGVGTADATAIRFDRPALGADNLVLKYAVELGAPFGALFTLVMAGIAVVGARLARLRHASRTARALGATVALASIGMLANGMTAVVTNSTPLAYVFYWLAGAVATRAADLAPSRHASPRPPHAAIA